MAKKESTFINMVFSLFMVTLVASATLGFVYELTKEPIRLVEITRMNNAIMAVVPEFNNQPSMESFRVAHGRDSLTLYQAKLDGELVGTAVETFTMGGFSGLIRLMVGFAPDGTIIDVVVLHHMETPGLGDKIEKGKSDFSTQFMGQHPSEFKLAIRKDNGDVDGITASTITSRAYCEAVAKAYEAYMATIN